MAFVFALLTASSVSTVYWSLKMHYPSKNIYDSLLVHLPFSLWHAFSLFAVVLSAFALFTKGIAPGEHHPGFTVKVLVLVAEGFLASTALGYAFHSKKGDVAGALVIALLLYGIYDRKVSVSRGQNSELTKPLESRPSQPYYPLLCSRCLCALWFGHHR